MQMNHLEQAASPEPLTCHKRIENTIPSSQSCNFKPQPALQEGHGPQNWLISTHPPHQGWERFSTVAQHSGDDQPQASWQRR